MRNAMLRVLAGALVFAAVAHADDAGGGSRIPNNVEQLKIDRPLHDKYKAEFASRDAGERDALAHKLRDEADANADTAVKYVLLRNARDLAMDAGDFSYSFGVIDDIAAVFPINAAESKANVLAAGLDRSRLAPGDLARSYMKICDEQMGVGEADLAQKAAYMATKAAAGDPELLGEARKREKLARVKITQLHAAQAAMRKLQNNPDDPEQNQLVGVYLCLNVGRWPTGLPYLAKAASAPLKGLADRELANPPDAAAMAALADDWWKFSDEKANVPQGAARARAAYWYAKAAPNLTGEKKAEAEKRIADVNSAAPQ